MSSNDNNAYSPRMTLLGTGSAFPTTSYNACFTLTDMGTTVLVDAGGGNGILRQLAQANIAVGDISAMFISHSHTDHILGAIWVVRELINLSFTHTDNNNRFRIIGNRATLDALRKICELTLLASHYRIMNRIVEFIETETCREPLRIGAMAFSFFDVGSENVSQSGFKVVFSNGTDLVFLGDEALTDNNKALCVEADRVICGAFCRFADADIFHPYEKHHYTIRDVAKTAQSIGLKRLIVVHSEDRYVVNRERLYQQEAAEYFEGILTVPRDLDIIQFD